MRVSLDPKLLENTLLNIIEYSYGFVEGINRGKRKFLDNIGRGTVSALAQYIDAEARANPNMLHHVYEWNRSGSPNARLFNLDYTVSNIGLSFKSSFSQSKSIRDGSTVPFYNKASIMESGIPVTIKPKKNVLVFEVNGETIFTKNEVFIENPGGEEVAGSFEKTFDMFFSKYFSQAFIRASGLLEYLQNPVAYKKDIKAGSKSGKSQGIRTGYNWIVNAKLGVEDV